MHWLCWFWLDKFVQYLVPFVCACVSFVVVFVKLKKSNKKQTKCESKKYSASIAQLYLRKITKNKRILGKLFAVNIYFSLSVLPHFVYNVIFLLRGVTSSYYIGVHALFSSNHALNFCFYGMYSHTFWQVMRRVRAKYRKRLAKLVDTLVALTTKLFGGSATRDGEFEATTSKKFE